MNAMNYQTDYMLWWHTTRFVNAIITIIRSHRSTTHIHAAYCHTSQPRKNGSTDRDANWVEDSGGSKKPRIRWHSDLHKGKGIYNGEKGGWHSDVSFVKKNSWTDRDAIWAVDSGGPKEARWQHLVNTTEPSFCNGGAAFLSNYFNHLLLFLHTVYQCSSVLHH